MQLTARTVLPAASAWSTNTCRRLPPLFFSRHQSSLKSTVPSLLPTVRGFRSSKLSAAEVQEEAAVTETGQFDWSKHWYPIILEKEVVTTTPYPFELLGRDLLLWKDKDGEWSCLEDRCPHRQAALSKGRFSRKDGSLMCSFHGWSFDSKGKCVNIPQATSEKQAMILAGKKAHVQSFPIRIWNGLICVWPDDAPSAWIEASATPIDMPEELRDMQFIASMTESPIGYMLNMEAAFDPAHTPITHEGQNSLWSEESAIPFGLTLEEFGPKGFTVKVPKYVGQPGDYGRKVFVPPALSITEYISDQSRLYFLLFVVPTKSAKCRTVFCIKAIPSPTTKGSTLLKTTFHKLWNIQKYVVQLITSLVPEHIRISGMHWIDLNGTFISQDTFLLMELENSERTDGTGFRSQDYLPTDSDLGVSVFRKWMDKYGGGASVWCSDPKHVSPLSTEEAHDMWDQHTKHCKACRQTVKDMIALKEGLGRVASVCLAGALGLLLVPARYVPIKASMLGLVSAAVCMMVKEWLDKKLSMYYSKLQPGHQPGNVSVVYRETTA